MPFKHLGIPRKGKLPPHLLVAAAIFNVAKPAPLGANTFCSDLAERMNELRNEHDSSDLEIIMTRKFTAEEAAIYSTGIMPTSELESDKEEPAAAAPAAAPAAAASSPAKASKAAIAAAAKSQTSSPQVARAPVASRADVAAARAGAGKGARAVGAVDESVDESVAAGGEAPQAPPAAPVHRGRIKAKATYREVPPSRPGRKREEPDRYAPPETPPSVRVVVKKRKSEADTTPSATSPSEESTPFAIPVSAQSSRVMPGELHINKRFSKTYMSIHPLRPAPLDDMTVSSLWHAVSLYHCVT